MSDTTPLINLAGVGLLDLLRNLYGSVSIPRVVAAEYQAKAMPSDPDLVQLGQLTIVDAVTIDPGLPKLGAGEAAAISLAISLPARLILLDERKARRIAADRGLTMVGTLAVLVRAKRQGIIPVVGPVITATEAQGRYFDDALVQQVLKDAGEQPMAAEMARRAARTRAVHDDSLKQPIRPHHDVQLRSSTMLRPGHWTPKVSPGVRIR